MKKTTTIHLSGILFNIEEDAFEKLSNYLKSIENHFSQHSGKKEILEDIETRIAEILSEKLSISKQVITIEDIDVVISKMGSAEQFDDGNTEQSKNYQDNTTIKRRIYRNPDDKIIGGVCGGIAAYFDIDPLWIRLIWAIAFFAFGTGLFLYILLWIIIPEAKTPSQKLEMKGESVNISNIGKEMATDLKQFSDKSRKEFSNLSRNKFVAFFQELFSQILIFILKTGKIILKVFSVFVLLISLIIVVALLSSLFTDSIISIHSKNFELSTFLSDFFVTPFNFTLFNLSVFLLIGIPFIALMIVTFKFLFNIKRKIRYLGITLIILWILGWGMFVYSIIPVAENYSEKSFSSSQISQYILPNKTIYIKMIENDETENDEENFKISINHKIFYSETNKKKILGFPSVIVQKSKDDSLRIKVISSAVAENSKKAREYAQNILYSYNIQDSIIELKPSYDIPANDKFHFQKVKVIIQVPANRYVYFSKNMKLYLDDAENNIDAETYEMVGKKWLMGIEHLQCLENCNPTQKSKNKNEHEDDSEE